MRESEVAAVWSRCLTLLSLLVARARQVQDSLARKADRLPTDCRGSLYRCDERPPRWTRLFCEDNTFAGIL